MVSINKLSFIIGSIAAITFISSPTLADTEKDRKCLEYSFTDVTLTGRVYRELYAGPPNYESIKGGDMPFSVLILKLDNPICVIAEPDDELNATVYNVKEVQINRGGMTDSKDVVKHHKGIINKKVVVTGSFYHRHTGYHRRRIVLWTNDIKLDTPQTYTDLEAIDDKCLAYEPTTVSITGTLYKARFRSFPETLSDKEREKRFSAWILFLNKHVCVINRTKGKEDDPEYDVTRIQFLEDGHRRYLIEAINGKNVAVSGKLAHSTEESQWADVLMKIESLEVLQK
ncbi:MAG: DUF4431 domain-containing protein [Nitrospinota bacterium]